MTEADDPKPAAPRPRGKLSRSLLMELAVALAVLLAIVAGARFGPMTAPGRATVARYLDGLTLGPWGRLHVSDLQGDIWRDFTLGRVSISDQSGVWLDMNQVEVRWRPLDLARRRFHAELISAAQVRVYRRPTLGPAPPPSTAEAPLSIQIDSIKLRLESRPAFSVRPGLFDIAASLKVNRRAGLGGAIKLQSLTRAGDGLDARFDVGFTPHLMIQALAREGEGGAIAGSLGLPANQPFGFAAHADGTRDQGQFRLRATSAGQTPATADGVWSKTGGSAHLDLSLAASTLTSPAAHAIGPRLGVDMKGQGAAGGLDAIHVAVQADNLTGSIAGLVDRNRLTAPKGLRIIAAIKDLTRVIPAPAMGAGAFEGSMAGGLSDWRLAGGVAVNRIGIDGYSLARAGGPISLDLVKGELRLQTSLTGQGGAGQGLVAALAGPKPRVSLRASQLPDGRTLINALSADGAGFSLTAAGDRNLFGGLSLKGSAHLSNLAAAQTGASGQIDARWSAVQARATTPWSLILDAQAQGLATGYAEADRLLGGKPSLHAQADYGQGTLSLGAARLTGAAANLGAKGVIGGAGDLKLALDWAAEGPFEAGPLEISGKANGSGDISGTLAAPKADLLADFERIDLPSLALKPAHVVLSFARAGADTDGLIAINAGTDYGPAHAKAAFQLVDGGVALRDIEALAGGLTAKGSVDLRKAPPSLVDLTLTLGPGAFISQGAAMARLKVADAGGAPTASLKLSADNLVPRGADVTIQTARVSADGPLSRLPFTVTAQAIANGAPVRLSGSGVAAQIGPALAVSFDGGGRVRRADFKTLSPATFTLNGPASAAKLSLALGGGRADITAHQDVQGMAAKGALTGVDLAALGEDLVGKFDADFSLSGHGANLDGALNAHLSDARSRDAASSLALEGAIKAVLAGQRLTIEASGGGAKSGGRASVDVTLPVEVSAAPFRIAINQTRPMTGRFDADGELQPIWDLFFGGDRSLGGHLVAQGTLGGTLNAPVMLGHAAMSDGKLEDAATGLKLRNLAANIDLTNNLVSVQNFSASDAKTGSVTGEGRLSLVKGGESTLTLNVKAFQLIDNEAAKATATGAVTVTRGGDGHAKLSGELNIDRADISAVNRTPPGVVGLDVIERNRPGGQDEGIQPTANRGPAVALDIKLRAARGVYLKGLGLNAEMSLSADVTGDTDAPRLSGSAHVLRGAYDFAGKRFDIDDSSVVYLDSDLNKIRLDLSATRDDPTLTAVIRIKGTAAKPEITLTSTPTLPNDEVLSQVLFGKSAAQLSGVEAAQLAAAVTTLATGGGFDVIGGLRSFARLDRLALGTDTLGAPTVSGGKYISEHVYLELTGGGKQGPSGQVEVTAGHGLSVISSVGGLEGAKLAVRWRLDYGKAKPARPRK